MENNARIRKLLEDMQALNIVCAEKRATNKEKAKAMIVIGNIKKILYEYAELSEALRTALK